MNKVQSLCSSFLWLDKDFSSKKACVAWDKLALPFCFGGLGVINLLVWNKACMVKHLWDFSRDPNSLWLRWMHTYYIKNQCLGSCNVPIMSSGNFKKIMKHQSIVLTWGDSRRLFLMVNFPYQRPI